MGNHRPSGLIKRGGVWHIDKMFRGTRIRESTSTGNRAEALEQLAKRIDQIRTASVYGLRTDRSFRAAATKFLEENQHKRSLSDDAKLLRQLDPFIGDLMLRQVHMGSLQAFIAKRRADGVKTRSINNALSLVRHVLNLAACEWRDEQGLTWLEYAPKIKLLKVTDGRAPHPLSREEQAFFFRELPDHLARMALFKVNTGCREQEVCGLRWDYEVRVAELETSVFMIPGGKVKNGQDRLVVLNRIARSVIESQRGLDRHFVFTYLPPERKETPGEPAVAPVRRPLARMITSAWKKARERAADRWEKATGHPAPEGFRNVRVHDLKHTFGRRLRAAGVSFEDRQDLLGHKSSRITTHYSAAELANLIAAAEKACETKIPTKVPTTHGSRGSSAQESASKSLKLRE
jgi:integrase